MKIKNFNLFIINFILSLLAVIFLKNVLNVDDLVYNFYSEQITQEQLDKFIENKKRWEWVGYVILPILILIRTSLVTLCLNIGLFFYDTENKIKFKQLFRIALLGEFVLVLVGFVKLLYFLFIKTDYTLQDIQQFYPLSYINFLDIGNSNLLFSQ